MQGIVCTVRGVRDAVDLDAVRRLVLAHAAARARTPGVEYVHADAAGLPGPYVAPRGGLWLAMVAGRAVGCVALRPLSAEAAEVKRLFVERGHRGHGVGRALMERVISEARSRGYATLRLGTLDDMEAAKTLYHSLGFAPVPRYRPDEMVDTRFFELALRGE